MASTTTAESAAADNVSKSRLLDFERVLALVGDRGFCFALVLELLFGPMRRQGSRYDKEVKHSRYFLFGRAAPRRWLERLRVTGAALR